MSAAATVALFFMEVGVVKRFLIFILIILLWNLACQLQLWTPYILPSPARVGSTCLAMLRSGELTAAITISLQRIAIGFVLAFLLSFALALVGCRFPRLRPYYSYLIDFVRHVPPLSLIPLLILWAGIGEAPKIIVIVLAAFAPILLNIDAGLSGCDKKLLEVGNVLGLTPGQQFWQIRLPYALPNILVGLRIGLGYSLRAIIGAELVAASSGLGYLILDAQTMSRTDKALVGIIFIGILGLALDTLLKRLSHKLLPYREEE